METGEWRVYLNGRLLPRSCYRLDPDLGKLTILEGHVLAGKSLATNVDFANRRINILSPYTAVEALGQCVIDLDG